MASVAFLPSPSRLLEITLPDAVVSELEQLAEKHNRPVDDLFLDALGLLKIASDAAINGQRLSVVDRDGKLLKEIVVFR